MVLMGSSVRQTNRQLATSNAWLKEQAEIDPLTGLANRRHLQEAMRRLGADGSFAGTVFLADLDHFKRINDSLGHAAGDAVLIEVAQRLRSVLRDADLIVRWGGEEFLVIVRALDADAVQALAQRMLDVIGGMPSSTRAGAFTPRYRSAMPPFRSSPRCWPCRGNAPSTWSTPRCTWPRPMVATAPMACACCMRATSRS
jgi:diguanylate cyclase (GGDEF)-like protein